MEVKIIGIPSIKIIDEGDDIIGIFLESLKKEQLSLEDYDIVVIASKAVSFSENRVIDAVQITPRVTNLAKKVAQKAKISDEFAQVILEECNYNFIGVVPGAITTMNEYGLLANAGADQSNVGANRVILLPKNCKDSAKKIHDKLKEIVGKKIGIIIADSRTMPMRLGTVGCALGTYGFRAVLDERGKKDLFGRKMHITTRAIADQLATAAEIVMGETDEQTPFAIIRNYKFVEIKEQEENDINTLITAEQCMFIGPLLNCIKEKSEKQNAD